MITVPGGRRGRSTGAQLNDPFGTAGLRQRVLAAWAAAPARFREDANAEEELALGAYRDRLVVELAQNAADAALRAGIPGRLRLRMADGVLTAANTGAPLDPAAVEALSTLRASAKRDDAGAAGRFGVGFAAVRSVTDAPRIGSRTGAVQWSLSITRDLVAAVPRLTDELARRGTALPVLRLPLPTALRPPAGFETVVQLPLRDGAAEAAVRQELAAVDPALLLALPALAAIEVEVAGRRRRLAASWAGDGATVHDDDETTRWRVVRRSGRHPDALLADRPVEERGRPGWSLLVAVPVDEMGAPTELPASVPRVVRAPTVTAEALSPPVVLVGGWPLDSTRRHIAPGPLRDALVEEAAAAYAELVTAVAVAPAALDLVPTGLAAGELDGRLRAAILARLGDTPFLPVADGGRVRPRDALALDLGPAAVDALAAVVADLLPDDWAGRRGPLAVLGVRRWGGAELADVLAGLDRPHSWWHRLYDALASTHLGGPERDALGALPVLLADGRLVTGPRGLVVPTPEVAADPLTALGLRPVHPAAAHPLLLLLGAEQAEPRRLLDDPQVRAAVATSYDAEDPGPVAEAVLTLVAAAGVGGGQLPALAELALPGADGEWYPAGELLLPGGGLAEVVAPDAPFGTVAPWLVEAWGTDVLRAAGVLDGFAVLRDADVPLDPAAPGHDLDQEEGWLADVLAGLPPQPTPPLLVELVAVRDLELVRPDAWPAALALLPREVLAEPAYSMLADGQRVTVPSYLRWWLSRSPVLDGRRPADLAVADDLAGLYDPAPAGDPALLRLLGVRGSLDEVLAEPGGPAELLGRLADPDRELSRDRLRRIYERLAGRDVPPPERVRAVRAGQVVVVDVGDAVVVDAPDLLPLLGDRAVLPVPLSLAEGLADSLDLPLASELASYEVRTESPLAVADVDGRPTPVPWRVVDGVAYVDPAAGAAARGRATAWRDGRWADRWFLTELLRAPDESARLLAEHDLDETER